MTKNSKLLLCLFAILALAAFFRIWQLDTVPPGLYPDEAINANEAVSSPGNIFYPENNGREGLHINLLSLSFWIFGISVWAMRIVSALLGIATVLGIYLLAKELMQGTRYRAAAARIALFSGFFLATSFWHVNFSRIGFRAILVPLILTFAFYFLSKGFRLQKAKYLVFGGIIFGLGFYTYIAFRLAVVILAAFLVLWWLIYKKDGIPKKKYLSFSACFLLLTIAVALPIGLYFLQNPDYFVGRAAGVSVFSQDNPLAAAGKSLVTHLGMFNFSGDYNWRHNISGSPILFWPVGILFLIGLFVSAKEIIKRRKDRLQSFPFWILMVWFLAMLLPGILTCEGIPHSLRCIGAIPAVFVTAAVGTEFLYQKIKGKIEIKRNSLGWWLVMTALLFLAVTFVFAQYSRYFLVWGQDQNVEGAFAKDYVKIGNHLNALGADVKKYVIVNVGGVPVPYPDGIPMPAQTLMFIERTEFQEPRACYLTEENLDEIDPGQEKTAILPMNFDEELILKLWDKFPQGQLQNKDGVWIYKINF